MKEERLELREIQGLVASGFSRLPYACYLLIHIDDPVLARKWLAGMIESITHSDIDRRLPCSVEATNIAFTYSGLKNLGMSEDSLETFDRPFIEGMTVPYRSIILGDTPYKWSWGNEGSDPSLDVLLLVFARSDDGLKSRLKNLTTQFGSSGMTCLRELPTSKWSDFEHFGFRDGVSQPIIPGMENTSRNEKPTTRAGEIVLGYPNESGFVDYKPLVPDDGISQQFLEKPSKKDVKRRANANRRMFGRNGSYLVVRQIEQNVPAFWRFVRGAAITIGESDERFAARMIGRWRNGAPLASSPDIPDSSMSRKNDFSYSKNDPGGLKCPFGAHIRRTNPRDSLLPQKTTQHRILRRGRSYGPAIKDRLTDDNVSRGLYFICLNSDIERQFELIQQTWCNNTFFSGLTSEVDPIGQVIQDHLLTLQEEPLRRQVIRLNKEKPFVEVKGGAYFFLPGISSLRYLAAL